MQTSTAEYLRHIAPKPLGGTDFVQARDDPMVGIYPSNLKNSKAGASVIVVGGGEVYQRMIAPAMRFLGTRVHLFDPQNPPLQDGEVRLQKLEDAPEGIPVFILSPNKHHAQHACFFMERGNPVAVEKPICLSEEVDDLVSAVQRTSAPTYWIDFNLMMGRAFIALASGVNMPFMDRTALGLEDSGGAIDHVLHRHAPLIKDKPIKIVGHYLQEETAPGGGIDHRPWLSNVSEGGGIMRDLMTRMFNVSHMIGMECINIDRVDLHVSNREAPGQYLPILSSEQAEQYAAVTGTMKNNGREVAFDFVVGKYAAKNDLRLVLEYEGGDKLTLEWMPPNRKNRVVWTKSDGTIGGNVSTQVDPYLLIVLDALRHFDSHNPFPLYFAEQAKSVRVLGEAARIGRTRFDSRLGKKHTHQNFDPV